MKRHYICLILLMVFLGLSSCQRDFDPANSKIQTVYFNIDPRGCFSNIPYMSGDSIQIGLSDEMDANHQMRISAFCYGQDSILITQAIIIRDNISPVRVEFKHIDISHPISCLFVVDFVQKVSYGTSSFWQIESIEDLRNTYLAKNNDDSILHYNSLFIASWDGTYTSPISLTLTALTTMGFVHLYNVQRFDKIEISYEVCNRIRLVTRGVLKWDFDKELATIYPSREVYWFPIMFPNTYAFLSTFIKESHDNTEKKHYLFFENTYDPFVINVNMNMPDSATIRYYE